MTEPPNSAAIFSPLSALMSMMQTFAPSPARSRTQASPRPEAPPVTTATQPLMSMVPLPFLMWMGPYVREEYPAQLFGEYIRVYRLVEDHAGQAKMLDRSENDLP